MKKYFDIAIAANTQTTGVRVKIKRTITPAKYDAKMAYKTTEKVKADMPKRVSNLN